MVEETAYDPQKGHEALLARAEFVPSGVGIEEVLRRADRVARQTSLRRDEFGIETPWPAASGLIYDFLGIRFADPLTALQLDFWAASVTTTAMPGAREALEEFSVTS